MDEILPDNQSQASSSTLPFGGTGLELKTLSSRQEGKLVDYIDEEMIRISSEYKKRSLPTTSLPTLHSYLTTTHHLLSLIMLIPPLTRSARMLRTEMMLRFTGEILDSVIGYSPTHSDTVLEAAVDVKMDETEVKDMNEGSERENAPKDRVGNETSMLRLLLAYLDDLDKAWLAVLKNQLWDSEESIGRDIDNWSLSDPASAPRPGPMEVDVDPNTSAEVGSAGKGSDKTTLASFSTSISQTDRTRLRSLLITGTEKLEDWLPPLVYAGLDAGSDSEMDLELEERSEVGVQGKSPQRVMGMKLTMDAMDEREMFNDLFWRTLTVMGELR